MFDKALNTPLYLPYVNQIIAANFINKNVLAKRFSVMSIR